MQALFPGLFFTGRAQIEKALAIPRKTTDNTGMEYRIYVLPNLTKEKYAAPVRAVIDTLEKRGFICLLSEEDALRLYGPDTGRSRTAEALAGQADLVLSVGGDGTFLRAGQTAIALKKPLCGCNAGRLGYLCALSRDELAAFRPEALVFAEEPVLRCTLGGLSHYALSDVVIGKDYFGGTIVPAWKLRGEEERHCIGDGLIVSTPLGSTGYTASAGGPLLKTGCGRFALTPICPHTGHKEPCVFEDTEKVTVRSLDPTYSASLYADGRLIGALGEAVIEKAPFTLPVAIRAKQK